MKRYAESSWSIISTSTIFKTAVNFPASFASNNLITSRMNLSKTFSLRHNLSFSV